MSQDRGLEVAAVSGLFVGLTWLFVGLRVYVKLFLTRNWGADDYLVVVSLILYTAYNACSFSAVRYGTGKHTIDVSPQDLPKAVYFWSMCQLLYIFTLVCTRLSIAVFLLRICVRTVYKIIIYLTLALMILYSLFYFFLVLFQCSPVSYFWNQYEGQKGKCVSSAIVPDSAITHSVVNFAVDWILGLLPIALVWNLQMNTRAKISVAAILSLGLIAGIAALVRIPSIRILGTTPDFLYNITDIAIWSTVEPGLGIVAASAATLRPLFRNFFSLTNPSSYPQTSTHAATLSRAGYVQQSNLHDVSSTALQKSESTSSLADNIELQRKTHVTTTTTSVRSKNLFGVLRSGGKDGGIQVDRTVEITRTRYEDQFHEEPHAPWPRGKERDMV